MKQYKFIEAEQISLEELSENLVSLKMGEEKLLIDTDTLYDMAFRFASFLTYLENRPEQDTKTRSQSELH
ncbi:hypothetical protein D3C87_1688590 [compost metagenome]